jgi:hypothetical protein
MSAVIAEDEWPRLLLDELRVRPSRLQKARRRVPQRVQVNALEVGTPCERVETPQQARLCGG